MRTESASSMSLTDVTRLKEKMNLLAGQKPSPTSLSADIKKASSFSYKLAADSTGAPGLYSEAAKAPARQAANIQSWGQPAAATVQAIDAATSALPGGKWWHHIAGTAPSLLGGAGTIAAARHGANIDVRSGDVPSWRQIGQQNSATAPARIASPALGSLANLFGNLQAPVAGPIINAAAPFIADTVTPLDPSNPEDTRANRYLARAGQTALNAPATAASIAQARRLGSIRGAIRTPLGSATASTKAPGVLRGAGRLAARAGLAGVLLNGVNAGTSLGVRHTEAGANEFNERLRDLARQEHGASGLEQLGNTVADYAGALTGDVDTAGVRSQKLYGQLGLDSDAKDTMDNAVREANAGENAAKANSQTALDMRRWLGLPAHLQRQDPANAQIYNEAADAWANHLGDLADNRTYTRDVGSSHRAPVMPAQADSESFSYLTPQEKQMFLQKFGPSIFGTKQEDGSYTSILTNPTFKLLVEQARANNPDGMPQ